MLAFLKNLFQPKKLTAAQAWQQAGNTIEGGFWLYAAPVHLVLQRDSFSLAPPAPLPIENNEIDALTTALNKHFEADNMQFFWHENTWILRSVKDPNIDTSPPEKALNKLIDAHLPKGNGAMEWAKFTNEIQMLLFEHPVNLAREAKKMPVINSIWCYES